MKHRYLIISLSLLLVCVACQREEQPQYIIGVSQCSDDAWRQKMNKELETELIFHPEVQLRIRQAQAQSALQCAQIDSFIAEKVDALIVCPNEAIEVQPAVSRAYAAGIPVVIADRRVSGSQWSAFVGGDNLQVGQLLGEWLLTQPVPQGGVLHVVEVGGLPGSTPAVARHRGLRQVIAGHKEIRLCEVNADWYPESAYRLIDSLLLSGETIDVIVAHNDQMAIGASQACNRHYIHIPIIGVDAISGQGGGLEAILNEDITASVTYASRGDLVLQRAVQILYGEPYPRETHLETMLVNRSSARSMQEIAEMVDSEVADIHHLQEKIRVLHSQYALQQAWLYTMVLLIVVLLLAAVSAWYIYRYRARLKQEREEHKQTMRKQQEQLERITAELAQTKAIISEDELFINRLQQEIEKHLEDSDLAVEKIADILGVSRTMLFRKTKAATGYSPIELIHHIRLHKAQELLQKSDMTIQQVAYSVGFTTASYFAKLYKQEFGVSPSDAKR